MYATVLQVVSLVGLGLAAAGFAARAAGLLPGRMAPEALAALWHLPASELQGRIGGVWEALRHPADAAGLVPLAFLALGPAACLLAILPVLLRERSFALALIVAAEIVVLTLAASGIAGAGR